MDNNLTHNDLRSGLECWNRYTSKRAVVTAVDDCVDEIEYRYENSTVLRRMEVHKFVSRFGKPPSGDKE